MTFRLAFEGYFSEVEKTYSTRDKKQTFLTTSLNNLTSIWSSNTSRHVKNPIAQLLDSGNLVVKDANDDNPENFLWQSFDYPTDTLLPGMKIGKNLATGRDWYLSSWKSSDDPGQGLFTYWLDIHGYPQFWGSNGSVFWYRSGPWNGLRFSGDPSLKKNSIYRFNFVVDKREIYYSYDLLNSSVISRFLIRENGLVQRWTWVDGRGWVLYLSGPTDACDYYAVCGAYGRCNVNQSPICGCLERFVPRFPNEWAMGVASNGCVRRTPLDCASGDGFLEYTGVKLPDTQHSSFNESMNLKECYTVCLRNCSCMAYATLNITGEGSGCLLWFEDLIDIRQFTENGQIIYIRVASSELDGSKRKKGKTIGISLALSMGTLTLILCLIFYIWKRKMKQQQKRNTGNSGITSDISRRGYRGESEKKDLELPLFDLFTLTSATDNFSLSNKLGEGGFGSVYKGILEEGQEIAVKRLSSSSTQGLDEFKNEVICIAKLQHRNLVKLLGCCIQGEEKMLIYEYMPNRSLDSFIFDKSRSAILDWPKRFHIINGIARGLLYLHQDSRLRIIHRDLKASNILLDSSMNPKISDFGMARSFGGDETEANTKRVVGTYGYMSPEYAVDGFFSVKSDVFSFGVLVLEIVSGKRNRGFFHADHSLNLLGHAWMLYKEGRFLDLLDEAVSRDSCYLSEVLRSLHVGLLCVQQHPEDRPTMASVVLMLGSGGPLPDPKQPGFFTARNLAEADCSSGNQASSSTNDFTITVVQPR
ncbi:G-type lectin S-receptor-like serine/threonine-protein kinase At4g27290 [Diospyros lotus]|uniref:G-type lectin S-receptor-like serine/threonine-protein kinase At4g27290 n=1 Tax=Diospyros lotus TaxID=55363 RepID=UPI00225991C4|nr:G-type lectin S-receptor-like serine/threonine-protein kinase At4g27290 [Diospyros lotus]